jgi:hypothetical protein
MRSAQRIDVSDYVRDDRETHESRYRNRNAYEQAGVCPTLVQGGPFAQRGPIPTTIPLLN